MILYKIEPASFVDYFHRNSDLNDQSKLDLSSANKENSIYVKNVNENEDFKLECLAKGRPKPKITWYLKYFNGSSFSKYLII